MIAGNSDKDNSSGIDSGKRYEKRVELVLVLFSDLYLLLDSISVGISRLSSCLISYYLLTTSTTDYLL